MKKVFCHSGCRESWITDMRYGLIYGATYRRNEDGTTSYKNHRQYCEDAGECPYCRARVVSKRRKEVYPWRSVA